MTLKVEEWYYWVDSMPSFVLLDGGLGHVLSERGNNIETGSLWSGRLLITCPEELVLVASSWLNAGADVVLTATYQATVDLIKAEFDKSSLEAERTLQSSVHLLTDCIAAYWSNISSKERESRRYPKVGVSMGPYSAVLADTDEYSGTYEGVSREDFLTFHETKCSVFDGMLSRCGKATDWDLYCFETIGNVDEAISIVDVMAESGRRLTPYWLSFQCRDSKRIACGETLAVVIDKVLRRCVTNNLIAIGINCVSVSDVKILAQNAKATVQNYMNDAQNSWRVDIVAYPNSGEVWSNQGWRWPSNSPATDVQSWAESTESTGAVLLGGCCRINEKGIEALHKRRGGFV